MVVVGMDDGVDADFKYCLLLMSSGPMHLQICAEISFLVAICVVAERPLSNVEWFCELYNAII